MSFQNPEAFILLLILPLLIYLRLKSQGRGHAYPSFSALTSHRTLREKLVYLPEIMLALSFLFIITALARPQKGFSQVQKLTKGIAIEMVVDRSGSMQAQVNSDQNRLDLVKELFTSFVALRPNDMIGLITFARYADTHAPLTLAHDVLPGFIKTIKLVDQESEDGTAIGDALALAAARLQTAEEEEGYKIKSRIIILLTDGVNNAGRKTPLEAAELAAEWGIKVYPIGFSQASIMGQLFGSARFSVDEESLKTIAQKTGGEYFSATDEKSLEEVFNHIDQLETAEVESYIYRQYRESYFPFALAGFICFMIYTVLSATVFRRLEL
jgi:Ca-activated chloride channel family protein